MEDEATAHAGRAGSPGRGQGSADRSGPPQPDPCYSPSPPPGLTSRGRLREVQPPLGRPSRRDSTLQPAGTDPTGQKVEPLCRPPEALDRTALWES